MRTSLCLLIVTACVIADKKEERRTKIPYIADAVGNTIPPPPNGPATVGSPVNLLTPDKYEFYTFDESGELVKRLMTLEEIQAIVAAGEESDGLVTFANENQPTITFNFSQPPYNKVHSVVTNVQNVLKAQMEAHKDKPNVQPTLDTPDVSNSWSLILPTIFGNTGGVDIVPDKVINSFTTPDTETIDEDIAVNINTFSKEGNNKLPSITTTNEPGGLKEAQVTEKTYSPEASVTTTSKPTSTSTTNTTPLTTSTTTTSTTTTSPTKTTPYSTTSSTTVKLTTTTTTIPQTQSTTTKAYKTTVSSTTSKYSASTTAKSSATPSKPKPTAQTTGKPYKLYTEIKPRPSTASQTHSTTTIKPKISTSSTIKQNFKTTVKATTVKATTYKPAQSTTTTSTVNFESSPQTITSSTLMKDKTTIINEKPTTYLPISTVSYIRQKQTEKTTQKENLITVSPESISSTTTLSSSTTARPKITTYKPSLSSNTLSYTTTFKTEDEDKSNITTVTTQSVSPSTTVSSTQFLLDKSTSADDKIESNIPLFDVALSISQIASDLGNNYQSIPTTSNLLESTKLNNLESESKENFDIDIPDENQKQSNFNKTEVEDKKDDNFVKISTIDPHPQEIKKNTPPVISENKSTITTKSTTTTIDPILSESMDDLLLQIVNENPVVTDNDNKAKISNSIENRTDESTTEKIVVVLEKNNENQTKKDNQVQSVTDEIISDVKIDMTTSNLILQSTTSQSTAEKLETSTPLTFSTTINSDSNEIPQNKNITENQEQEKKDESHDFVKISESKDILNDTFIISTTAKIEISNKNIEASPITPSKISTIHSSVEEEKLSTIKNKFKPFSKIEFIPKHSVTANDISQNSMAVIQNVTKESNFKENINNLQDTTPKDELKKKFQKVNIDDKELAGERNNSWKLISTVSPPKTNEIPKDKIKTDTKTTEDKNILLDFSQENQGLEVTTKYLGEDIAQFTVLCNELAFRYWNALIEHIDKKRSFVLSPFSVTSMLAMMFMGARGSTSGEMNEILKLDDMVTFNPHFTLKNISDSIESSPETGVAISAFVRELYSDKNKGQVLTFYKERAQHFYSGHVEEINFNLISDIIRRRTNLLVKRFTWGRITEFMKSNNIFMQPPLAAFSANIFYTDCSKSSVEGRDGEMYFVVSPNVRQRRLVPVPAVVYRDGFLAGYDPVLDATAAALGSTKSIVSTLFLMPGQQGNVVHAEDLEALERRLLDSNPTTLALNRILRTLLPRIGLELQIPRFSHKSIFNISSTLKQMGLKDLFDADHADLGGLNGPSKDLYLSDMVQQTTFVTCGEDVIGEQHHIEEYPESLEPAKRKRQSRWTSDWDEPRDYQRAFHDPHDLGEAMNLPLHLRPRQARLPARNAQPARLKFDRPFLYFVRHNPSGMILYVGRYNPRLLP